MCFDKSYGSQTLIMLASASSGALDIACRHACWRGSVVKPASRATTITMAIPRANQHGAQRAIGQPKPRA